MKVLIVSKTHLSGAFCVGGLARDTNKNVRLMEPGGFNPPVDTEYEIGDIWDIEFTPRKKATPPHIEDVIVHQSVRLGPVKRLRETLLQRVSVWRGDPAHLFDALIQFTPHGSGYIAAKSGTPKMSVGFWIPDQSLMRSERDGRIRYHTADYRMKITYVGVAESLGFIPAGTLLRVSLARWWKPDGADTARCYLQLSGWYL